MCAILGFSSLELAAMDMDALSRMIRNNIHRGPHAFGFSWINSRGRLRCYKQQGDLTKNMGLLGLMQDARSMILHLRFATHGKPENNINNHPHACDGGWVMHNGYFPDYEELLARHDLWPVSKCDSETIGLLMEESPKKTKLEQMQDAFGKIGARGPLCFMGLWKNLMLVARRNSNPLNVGRTDGGLYFASIGTGLPGDVAALNEGDVVKMNLSREGSAVDFQFLPGAALPPRPVAVAPTADEALFQDAPF